MPKSRYAHREPDKQRNIQATREHGYGRCCFRGGGAQPCNVIAYAQLGQMEEAQQEFYWAIDHSPVPSAQHYSNAGEALIIMGRFDEAKRILDQWRQKGSLNPLQTILRYRIALSGNDTATMERLARETPGGRCDLAPFRSGARILAR
jgi:tetratricopeptide (TPR) repeat protein